MRMRAEHVCAFCADRAIAERSALGRAGDDADVERHRIFVQQFGTLPYSTRDSRIGRSFAMKLATRLAMGLTTVCTLAAGAAPAPTHTGADYVFTGDIDAGGPGFWDYLTLDAKANRLYLAHV